MPALEGHERRVAPGSGRLCASKRATDEEGIMRVTGITANLPVADIATASEFYREYLA